MYYLIKNVSLVNNSREVIPQVTRICELVCKDKACFKIVNSFFLECTNNGISKEYAKSKLDSAKKECELNNMPVDDAFYSALEEELSSLFENSSVNEDKYISIYSNYLEYIVKIWQSIPDENGLVEHVFCQ